MNRIFGMIFVLLAALAPSTVWADRLQASISREDITPPLALKAPLGGYGERMNQPARGVHDRIFAKAICFTNGSRRFVVVTADLIGFPPPFKAELVRELNSPKLGLENLILLPSHSHTSVEMNAFHPGNTYGIPQIGIYSPDVHRWMLERFSALIRRVQSDFVPVKVGTGSVAISGWNRNRRQKGGFCDEELTITRVDSQAGQPLAVLVNFAAHPTFLGAEQMEFSGDWPGQMQRTLETLLGPQATVMYYNGAEGDQAPVARPDSGSSGWEKSIRFGTDLAVVANTMVNRVETDNNVRFDFSRHEIPLPKTSWHPKFMETGGAEYGLTESLLAEMLPKVYPKSCSSICLRIGDLLLMGVPGEMAAELGREIKQSAALATQARYPVIGGLADEWDSYILSAAEYRRGGYEASVSFYGESLGQIVVDGVLAGVRKLKAD